LTAACLVEREFAIAHARRRVAAGDSGVTLSDGRE
jgi:hypothetical protein